MPKQTLSFNGLTAKEVIAKAVQHKVEIAALKMTEQVVQKTPIWTGRMVNSWEWSKDIPNYKKVPKWDGAMRTASDGSQYPLNPLPRPTVDTVNQKYTFKRGEFPTLYLTCSVPWAYDVDQGAGNYKKTARLIVKHAVDEGKAAI